MAKLSVVIPIYGVEKYIEKCAISLMEQTLDDIEYIFIDDCSLDNSIEILKNVIIRYPERLDNVKIFQMETNCGLPTVRKFGIQHASANYIIHCDSDDYIDVDMYKIMYEKALENDCDMVVCGYAIDDNGCTYKANIKNITVDDDIVSHLLTGPYPAYMWNKLVKRDLYSNDIEWPKVNQWEDLGLMIQVMQNVKSIAYVNQSLYYYVKRRTSIVNDVSFESCLKKWKESDIIKESILRHIDQNKYEKQILTLKYHVKCQLMPLLENKEIWYIYNNYYPEIDLKLLFLPLPKSQKIRLIIYKNFYLIKILGFMKRLKRGWKK